MPGFIGEGEEYGSNPIVRDRVVAVSVFFEWLREQNEVDCEEGICFLPIFVVLEVLLLLFMVFKQV